jgi:hypothetical protein
MSRSSSGFGYRAGRSLAAYLAVRCIGESRVRLQLRYEAPDAERVVVAGGVGMLDPYDMEMRRDGDAASPGDSAVCSG